MSLLVINPQPRTQRHGQQKPLIGAPFTPAGVGRVDGAHAGEAVTVEEVHFAHKISKPSQKNKPSLGVERGVVGST